MLPFNDLTENTIYFYRSNEKFGFLSNLYPCKVIFENIEFKSSEFAYQYGKFRKQTEKEKEILTWAMQCPNSSLMAQLSHSLFSWQIVPDWNTIKLERMKNVINAKFSQNPELKRKLIETRNYLLVENSKTDSFWGCGKNKKGKNMLGILLMNLRKEFIENP